MKFFFCDKSIINMVSYWLTLLHIWQMSSFLSYGTASDFKVPDSEMNNSNKTLMFVGTYTDNSPSVGIYVYEVKISDNGDKVEYKQVETINVSNPSFLAITHDKKYLLAVTEVENERDSQLHSYRIENNGQQLTHVKSINTEGTVACFVVTDSRDKFAYVANYVGGSASAFHLESDGNLKSTSVARYSGTSGVVPNRQNGPHIHSVKLGIDERYVYIADLGNDRVVKLPFDPVKGFGGEGSQKFYSTPPGAGPRHMAFHPNGRYLYVANELASTVSIFEINKTDGGLKLLETKSTLPKDFQGESFVAEILVAKGGKFLYVSNRGHNSLAMFSIGSDGSNLNVIGYQSTKGKTPRNFNTFGNILFVANQDSNTIYAFKIQDDGKLSEINQHLQCPKPVCLKFLEL